MLMRELIIPQGEIHFRPAKGYNSPVDTPWTAWPFFQHMPPAVLSAAVQSLVHRRHPRGNTVFHEGDRPQGAFFLRSGLIKICKQSPSHRPLAVELVHPGEAFGVVAVLDRRPFPATAVALDASDVYEMPVAVFEDLLRGQRAFAREVHAAVGEHVRRAQEMRSLSHEPVDRRIAHVLLRLMPRPRMETRVRREDVADLAGCIPETAIRILADFKRRGWIRTGWRRIGLVNPAALRSMSLDPSR